ncbi:MAG: hypothetical protein LQ350_008323 [Teloschistes chrysophthalmus]|nr:MAG: hypothetical protein LQ350_008323 [Niorma chrysophthalma]
MKLSRVEANPRGQKRKYDNRTDTTDKAPLDAADHNEHLTPSDTNFFTQRTDAILEEQGKSIMSCVITYELTDAESLLQMLYFLHDSSVEIFNLNLAKEHQQFWSSTGAVDEEKPADLLSSQERISDAVSQLREKGLVIYEDGGVAKEGILTFDVASREVRLKNMTSEEQQERKRQALLFVCHTFPTDPYFRPLHGKIGRQQMYLVQHVVDYYPSIKSKLLLDHKRKIVRLLLSASLFGNYSWKRRALEMVEQTEEAGQEPYLQAWLNCRKCKVASLGIQTEIQDPMIWLNSNNNPDNRANAFYGKWLLAYATLQLYRNNIDVALTVVDRFLPLVVTRPSIIEALVLAEQSLMRGTIYRYKGEFTKAETLLQPSGMDIVIARQRTAQLACVRCELGGYDSAEDTLRWELRSLEEIGLENVAIGQVFRLSLAETLLMKGLSADRDSRERLIAEAEEHFRQCFRVIGSCDGNLATDLIANKGTRYSGVKVAISGTPA